MAERKISNTMKLSEGNREYRSDLFSMLMRVPEYALQVYNALNESAYSNPEDIEVFMLENGISMSVRNDASFIIGNDLNMYEHQSTYNPNMALRHLFYVTDIFRKMIVKKDLFSKKRIMLPCPHFVVFYNGKTEVPKREIIRLSQSFEGLKGEPNLELTCLVININPDGDEEFLTSCTVIHDYTYFVERVREYSSGNELADAIRMAIDECIDNNILKEFFAKNREEVEKMSLIDMTFERREQLIREEEREEGIQQGIQQGFKVLINILSEYEKDPKVLLEKVQKNPGFENVTLEMIEQYISNKN